MAGTIFDTNIWIAYKLKRLPADLIMSAVVMQELVTAATDKTDVRNFKASKDKYEREGKILVPDSNDWWQVGVILNSYLRRLKAKAGGRTPRLQQNEKARIVRDALIAVTANRVGALVVTDNLTDFEKIRPYCKVRLKSGEDYFGT